MDSEQKITARLIEYVSRTVLTNGFKSGTVQSFKPSTRTVTFTSLKLNKVGFMRRELAEKGLK